jgi:MFS family permease|tara:strand:- start:924 stop:2150 length:1227 start_codon:yes stop_codon:yes gene_type:complete
VRFDALASAPYRRFWLGSIASVGSTQLYFIAMAWLVFELSNSPLDLGLLGAATAVPNILATLIGGLVADRVNRRTILILTTGISTVLMLLLAALDATGLVRVWHVLLISGLLGLVQGFDFPARSSIFPSLIEPKQMLSAVALNSILWQGSRMIFPAIGGILIALTDTSLIFVLCGLGFITMLMVLCWLEVVQVIQAKADPWHEFKEGLRFVLHNRLFLTLILLTWISMFFGTSYIQIMPIFADILQSGERGYGLLISATGVGSVAGNLFISRFQQSRRLGLMMLSCAALAPFSLIGFSLVAGTLANVAGAFWLASLFAVMTAAFSSVFLVSSMTVLQLKVPDKLRGRVMGIHSITWSMIALGGLIAGALASKFSAPVAVVIGAVIVLSSVIWVTIRKLELLNLNVHQL